MIRYQYTVINMRSNESLVVVNNESSLMTSIKLDFTIQNCDPINVLLKITDDASQELNFILFENISKYSRSLVLQYCTVQCSY